MRRYMYIWMLALASGLCCAHITVQAQTKSQLDSLLNILPVTNTDTGKVKILLSLSGAHRQGPVTKEFYYADEALALSEKAGWNKGKMLAEQLIGDCYIRIRAHNDAITHFKLCMAYAKELGRKDIEAYCLQLMFHANYKLFNLPQALSCQKALVELVEQEGEPHKICDQRIAYVTCLSDNGRYAEAIDCIDKNIAFAGTQFKGTEKMNVLANMLNTKALVYIKTKQWDSALHCLHTAASMLKLTGDYFTDTYVTSTFCDLYVAKGDNDSAITYCERTVKMGEVIKDIKLQQQYSLTLSKLYESEQQQGPALFYYKISDSLIIIIDSTEKTMEQAMQVARIGLDQQAARSREEKKAFELVRRNQQAVLIAVVTTMVALIALTVFIYRNLSQKKKANKTISLQAASLQEQNETIDKALKEKEMLLKETHHRVKNNLQLISSLLELQAAGLEDEAAKKALRTAQDRVLSIATVHSKLYGNSDDEAIEFSAFVSDLFKRLNNAFAAEGKMAKFENAIPTTLLPLNTVVLLGLILNELITNSYKHAFKDAAAATISIGLEHTGDMYTLRYYDSGPGLPEGVFDKESGSLGLYIVRRLSKQLKGRAEYKFEAGSIFTIIFPHAGN